LHHSIINIVGKKNVIKDKLGLRDDNESDRVGSWTSVFEVL